MNARKVIGMLACVACALALLGGAAAQAAPFLYSANTIGESVSQFELRGGGLLAPLVPPSVSTPFPLDLEVSPDDRSVYTVSGFPTRNISRYPIGADGGLPSAPTNQVDAGIAPFALEISPDGKSLYATGYFSILQFDVAGDGSLSPKTPTSVPAGSSLNGFAMTSDGRNLYAAEFGGSSVSQWDVGADGKLAPKTPASVPTGGTSPQGIAVSRDNRSLYVANRDDDPGTVAQFDIGAGGFLTAKTPATVQTGAFPQAIATGADGRSVYVGVAGDTMVAQYDTDAAGRLTPKSPAAVGLSGQANDVVLSPDGRSLYAANNFPQDAIVQYDVRANGTLALKSPGSVPSGSNPFALAVTHSAAASVPSQLSDCLRGGWRRYGFDSQVACLVFVIRAKVCALLPRNAPKPKFCPLRPPRGSPPRPPRRVTWPRRSGHSTSSIPSSPAVGSSPAPPRSPRILAT